MSIDVAAPPQQVFEVACDLSRWPELLPHYRKVTIQSRSSTKVLAQMTAVRRLGPLDVPVTWRTEQWAESVDPTDLRLEFRHVRGVTSGMSVTWHIRPTTRGSRITIEHDFSRRLPLLGADIVPALVDRLFVRPIAGRTLATFKQLAERNA
jgi:ribosome-associated toxin RatA of RatAB toxin-antitoxin module